MKKLTLSFLFLAFGIVANAQVAVPSVAENLDVACATTPGFPTGWLHYNPPATPNPLGAWHCSPTGGNMSTPGLVVTGTYSGGYHLDTAYLVTPLLDLSAATGDVFMNFDTKTDTFHIGGKLEVLIYSDSPAFVADSPHTDITLSLMPLITMTDSTHWVTHQANLTAFKHTNFYVAFRYTSNNLHGNMWHIDNINTTTVPIGSLSLRNANNVSAQLQVVGISTPDNISLSFSSEATSVYRLSVYDMVGREVYKETLQGQDGKTEYTIKNAGLLPGMYIIKLGDVNSIRTVKVMIR